MKFEADLLKNQAFSDSLLTVNWYPSKKDFPASSFRCAEYLEDGTVILRIGAPAAREVKVIAQFGDPREDGYCGWEAEPAYGAKDGDGIFTVCLPWGRTHTGSRSLKIYIDGTLVVWPYLPAGFGSNRIQNYIEIPDHDMAFSYVYDVPHGAVISQRYHSNVTGREERCMIYTPPGYQKSGEEYPVLYLLHGGSDNETTWFSRARADDIMDNLLAAGECVPFLIVAVNDMYTSSPDHPDRRWEKTDGTAERVLLEDCLPFIEANYRVKKDRKYRAVGGLSLGALQACDCGFRHPELFAAMGFLTSIFEHDSYENALGRPWREVLADPDKVKADYDLIFCSATPQEDHFDYFLNDEKIMREAGLEDMPGYIREIHDGRFTRWCSWRIGLRDLAKNLFR